MERILVDGPLKTLSGRRLKGDRDITSYTSKR
jgi:hypothetical protein